MIEQTILGHLAALLDVPVYMEQPQKSPKRFVLLDKTGSSKQRHICRSTFAVQSYGGSLLEAAQLNEEAKHAMEQLAELDEIGAVRLNSDYNFTDTATKRYRYQAIFDITHY